MKTLNEDAFASTPDDSELFAEVDEVLMEYLESLDRQCEEYRLELGYSEEDIEKDPR